MVVCLGFQKLVLLIVKSLQGTTLGGEDQGDKLKASASSRTVMYLEVFGMEREYLMGGLFKDKFIRFRGCAQTLP